MKRAFDILFASVSLTLLFPLFIVVAIFIKIKYGAPVFLIHKRIGKDLKPFPMHKFRTMGKDASQTGNAYTHSRDTQAAWFGKFLRKTKIDDLPQLWNVLKGDMSIVGPRPKARKYVSKQKTDYKKILKVRPGLIDIASLTYAHEEKIFQDKKDPEEYYTHILLPEKIKRAKEYVRKAHLIYDLKLAMFAMFRLLYPHKLIIKAIHVLSPHRKLIVVGLQICVFIFSNYFAFFVRFDGNIPSPHIELFSKYLLLLILFRTLFLFTFSLDKGLWRYTSVRDLFNITFAISLGSLMFFLSVRYLFGEISYPRSIYFIDWFSNVFLMYGIRLFRQLHEKADNKQETKKRVIVFGAGSAADLLLGDIENNPSYPYKVIGLIDDNLKKKGLKIRNIPILGTRKDLDIIMETEEPDEFLIAIPSISPSQLQNIVKDLREYGKPIKTLPGLWGILSGKSPLNNIKELEPEDVLFRAPVRAHCGELKAFLEGKKVLLTGAGGSIGSELSRQIAHCKPENLILFERHEESLYKIDMELSSLDPSSPSKVTPIIGDILDEKRVVEVMDKFRPDIVFHAAAYKHVPLMEDHPDEAFKVNVMGTKLIAEKSKYFGVERFILISTDKSVNPVNVMGLTKKIAEETITALSEDKEVRWTDYGEKIKDANSVVYLHNSPFPTKYITVRFGNVLESSGSVVPLFKDQIKRGGPVTVTHPEIKRFFMTIPEAVNLVLQAANNGNGGEVFVLDMGKPIKILDLAKRMISLYGYKPGVDIDISFIGLRRGEKLDEELFNSYEKIEKTSHPKINMAISNGRTNESILETVKKSEFLRKDQNFEYIFNKFSQHFPSSRDSRL